MKNTKTITGLSLAALLALTACGDGDDADTSNGDDNGATEESSNGEEASGEVFEFEAPVTESNHGPYDEVTIQVPDELLENEPEYAEERTLDSVTLRAAERDEPGKCAMEATYNYSENVPEEPVSQSLERIPEHAYEGEGSPEEGVEESESYQEQGRVYEEILREESPTGTTMVNFIEERPTHEVYSLLIGRGGDDLLNEDRFSEDFGTYTYNVSCDSTLSMRFPTADWSEVTIDDIHPNPEDGTREIRLVEAAQGITWTSMSVRGVSTHEVPAFAEVEASVDSEGQITLYAPGVDGWEYDSNGNWVAR